jgi:hypothetical protein
MIKLVFKIIEENHATGMVSIRGSMQESGKEPHGNPPTDNERRVAEVVAKGLNTMIALVNAKSQHPATGEQDDEHKDSHKS